MRSFRKLADGGAAVAVEGLKPRDAKEYLDKWIAEGNDRPDPLDVRLTLARTAALDVLQRLAAFQTFRQELRAELAALTIA